MGKGRYSVLTLLGALQLVALLAIGLVDPLKFGSSGWFQRSHAVGIVLGCGFAQASVAATWAALGPLSAVVRLPCSAAWALATGLLIMVNIVANSPGGSREFWEAFLLAAMFVGVWCVVQAPLWMARAIYRFDLQLPADSSSPQHPNEHQFGIWQLLVVTTAVAATLALGRTLVLGANREDGFIQDPEIGMMVTVGLFVICNSLVAFTVITAALLRRHWLFGLAIGLCAAAAVTLVEWDLFVAIGASPDIWEAMVLVATMNGIQFGWLVVSLLVLRAAGYRLGPAAARDVGRC